MCEPKQMHEAVKRAVEKFGHIDYVVCGLAIPTVLLHPALTFYFNSSGAAGNFLAPIGGLSENAFRTVIEIDAVRQPCLCCDKPISQELLNLVGYIQHGESNITTYACLKGVLYPYKCHDSRER